MYPEPTSRSSSISLLLLHIFSSLISSNSILSVAYVKVIHNCSLSQCTSYQQILRLCLQNTSRTYVSQQLYCIHVAPSQYFSHRDSYHFSLGSFFCPCPPIIYFPLDQWLKAFQWLPISLRVKAKVTTRSHKIWPLSSL